MSIPKWLAKKLAYYANLQHPGVAAHFTEHTYRDFEDFRADITAGEVEKATGKVVHGATFTAHKLPEVCTECNGGWMARLEDAAGLIIPGFLEGKTKALAPFDQLVLATWVAKTALVYSAKFLPDAMPYAIGSRRLYKTGGPPRGTQIVLGHNERTTPQGAAAHASWIIHEDSTTSEVAAIRIEFQFEHMVLRSVLNRVEGNVADNFLGVIINPPANEQVIWPNPQTRLRWPTDAARTPPLAPTSRAEEAMPKASPKTPERPHRAVSDGVAGGGMGWGLIT